MNGFIRKTVAGLCLGSGLASLSGCYALRQCIDPCYPQRYSAVSRHTIYDVFNAQAYNGHVLDQTVWNYHFEVDAKGLPTDVLNPQGQEHLKYLVRRRPMPDGKVFLQTANDLPPALAAEKIPAARRDLDLRRKNAVLAYLAALSEGRIPSVPFEVAVHDPNPVYLQALPIAGARQPNPPGSIPLLYNNFQGQVQIMTGTGGAGGGGGGGAGGGGAGR